MTTPTDQELEQQIIRLWSRNGSDFISNVYRELPRILSALKQVRKDADQEEVRRIRHLNRLGSWAQQDPTGPMNIEGNRLVQGWVLAELKAALGSEYEPTAWQPSYFKLQDENEKLKTKLAALKQVQPTRGLVDSIAVSPQEQQSEETGLFACPFCGSFPEVIKYPMEDAHPSHDLVQCRTHHCPASYRAVGRGRWNKRVPSLQSMSESEFADGLIREGEKRQGIKHAPPASTPANPPKEGGPDVSQA